MIAWLLIVGLGTHGAITVPGIATEAACTDLGTRVQNAALGLSPPSFKCLSYESRR